MPGKDRTRIPRSSPPKSILKPPTTPFSQTPHHNAPILLRGNGKDPSALTTPFSVAGGTSLPPPRLPPPPSLPLDANIPNGATPQSQRVNGSRIPSPSKSKSPIGLGLGFSLSTSTPSLKTAPSQISPARTGRPSFHVPVIHSPASKFVSLTHSGPRGPAIATQGDGGRPVGPTVTSQDAGAGESSRDVVPDHTPPDMMRTPTAASNVSSESQYTIQSAVESAEGHDNTELRDGESDGRDGIADERDTADTKRTGVDYEVEDVVLSPGFDIIQALADTNKLQSMDHRTLYEKPPTTPRPRPFSRDITYIQQSTRPPPSPLTSVVTNLAPSSPATHAPKPHRRSLVAEAADMTSRNTPTDVPLHSHKASNSQTSKSKTPPPYSTSHGSGNIFDIIQQIEALIGHPCVDRDAVHAAHREAEAHSETGSSSGPVFGAKLNTTMHYASCSSVLGGQTHTLPLVVFACVEELYRAGLRSSRLLRPPPHAPATPSHTVIKSPAHSRGEIHSFPSLVAAFNAPPIYGDDVDLSLASLDDVGALLLTYLDCLPGGIVPVWVRGALGDAVGIYEEGSGGSDSTRERKRAINAAQLILRLLPAAQFSLLVYLLAFLSQIPLYEAWNGWNVRGVARAFARVVVGVGAGTGAGAGVGSGDVKGKGKDDGQANGKENKIHREEVDWVVEEEDAVEVLEWLLASWDDLSDGLFSGTRREGRERSDSEGEIQQEVWGEREAHRAAAMRQLDPPQNTRSDDGTTTVSSNPTANNPSVNALLTRIAFLERENAEWLWLQGQHKAELQQMFQAGERRIAGVEVALMEERNARARAEDALVEERVALRNTQTSTEDAVRAERTLWVREVQALREAWERMGNACEGVREERDAVGKIVAGIVGRFVIVTSKGGEGPKS